MNLLSRGEASTKQYCMFGIGYSCERQSSSLRRVVTKRTASLSRALTWWSTIGWYTALYRTESAMMHCAISTAR